MKVKPIKTVEYKYPMIQFLYYNSQLFNEAELCRLRRMLISLAEVLKTLPSNRPLPSSSFFRPKSEKSLKKPIQKLRVQPFFFSFLSPRSFFFFFLFLRWCDFWAYRELPFGHFSLKWLQIWLSSFSKKSARYMCHKIDNDAGLPDSSRLTTCTHKRLTFIWKKSDFRYGWKRQFDKRH